MLESPLLRCLTVAFLSILLLSTSAFAEDYWHVVDKDSETPLYLQLMNYVSELLTAGEEVSKQLLKKVQTWYAQGK